MPNTLLVSLSPTADRTGSSAQPRRSENTHVRATGSASAVAASAVAASDVGTGVMAASVARPASLRAIAVLGFICCWQLGCRPEPGVLVQTTVPPTDFATRAVRRAYDGAPPVIPHPPLGADCTVCHTARGQATPGIGFAPANPHLAGTIGAAASGGNAVAVTRGPDSGRFANCRQCHVFQNEITDFRENAFVGLPQRRTVADRLYPGAPPVMPHSTLMRENCVACHATESARPEIRCTHPDRLNCRQCHMEVVESASAQFTELDAGQEAARPKNN